MCKDKNLLWCATLTKILCHMKFLNFSHRPMAQNGRSRVSDAARLFLRLGLPLKNLRRQTYDGASCMSTGTQVLIAKQQPLAVYVHCLMHACNVVAQQAMESSNIIQDAASLTNDVAATCNRSTKLINILHSVKALRHGRVSL